MNKLNEPSAGSNIESYIELMLSVAKNTLEPVSGKFNGNYYLATSKMSKDAVRQTKSNQRYK